MNIEPFLVSSSLECLVAQRLVRVICHKCKIPLKSKLKDEVIAELESAGVASHSPSAPQIYEGKGCKFCRFTGYQGRTAIHEILQVNEPIRELILQRASSQKIKNLAVTGGMRTLRSNGLRKVAQGITTITEVMRVTQQEERA
jgi:type IV pilus assembly protein PilB